MHRFLILLCIAFTIWAGVAFAQAVAPTQEEENTADIAATELEVEAALAKIAKNSQQNLENTSETAKNTAAIAEQASMSGNQDFILKVLAIVVPAVGAIFSGYLVLLLARTKNEGEKRGQQQLDSLILVARSVNGVKSELVARTEAMAFMEGLKHAPGTDEANARIRELEAALKRVTQESEQTASEVVKELAVRHDQPGRMGDEVIVVGADDTKIVAGPEGAHKIAEGKVDPEEIVVLPPGASKIVKGEES